MSEVIGGSISDGPDVIGGSIGGSIEGQADPTSFALNQDTPAASWLINHNLNGFPVVTTVDQVGNVILGQVQYLNASTVLVIFSTPVVGSAYLNM